MSSAAQNTDNDENARYKRAIRTAEELFKKVGFRAVTMELVAREANVAKATLYSYFKNKDELFLAVCARMARLLRGAVEQALMKPDAPLDARVADAVIAKHRPIFALVRGSPHAAELFSYTHSMAGGSSRTWTQLFSICCALRWPRIRNSRQAQSSSPVLSILAVQTSPTAARRRPRWRPNSAHLPPPTWRAPGRSPSSTNRDESRTGHSKSPIQTTSSLLLTN